MHVTIQSNSVKRPNSYVGIEPIQRPQPLQMRQGKQSCCRGFSIQDLLRLIDVTIRCSNHFLQSQRVKSSSYVSSLRLQIVTILSELEPKIGKMTPMTSCIDCHVEAMCLFIHWLLFLIFYYKNSQLMSFENNANLCS